MFAIVQNGIIMMLVPAGTAFTWDGVDYPANWCNLSSPADKAAIGMVDVVYGSEESGVYYWVTQSAPVYNAETNQVDINYTSTPKDLTQVKDSSTSQTDATSYSILFPSDWMVVKSVETSTPMSPEWNTWRASVRTVAADTKAQVIAATTVAEVQQVMTSVVWPTSPSVVIVGVKNGN